MFPSRRRAISAVFPAGRVAQRESTSLTSRGSQVRSLSRPPSSPAKPQIPTPTRDRPVLRGFSPVSFPFSGLRKPLRSLRMISSLPSLHPKIPFPALGFDGQCGSAAGSFWSLGRPKARRFEPVRNYCGFNPRASNCRLHSGGASRSSSTPMPRGKRPSTAARTRAGARNASEIVMLT